MPLSRRDLLRATAAAALTAACAPAADDGAPSTAATTSTAPSPEGSSTGAPTATSAASASATESTSAAPTRSAPEVRHGPRSSPQVALTFHGSGDVSLAEQLLRLLESNDVQATVMAVGTWLAAEPAMAGRITDGGHDLGNHTLHHYPMRGLSAAGAVAEVRGCAKVLQRVSGSPGSFFRASGTQVTTSTIRRAAARGGYDRCISYDVDGLDWQDPSAATVTRAVLDGSRRGSIISLHLGHPVTISALPAIIDRLRSRGLRPVTLSELLA